MKDDLVTFEMGPATPLWGVTYDDYLFSLDVNGQPTIVLFPTELEAQAIARTLADKFPEQDGITPIEKPYDTWLRTAQHYQYALGISGPNGLETIEEVRANGRLIFQAPPPLND